jgi:hypothetical protein
MSNLIIPDRDPDYVSSNGNRYYFYEMVSLSLARRGARCTPLKLALNESGTVCNASDGMVRFQAYVTDAYNKWHEEFDNLFASVEDG